MAVIAQESLPPTEYLIMETLAARFRLGEHGWTFPSNVKARLGSLERRGLVGFKAAPVYGYQLAWLTDAGRACCLSGTYKAPPRPEPGNWCPCAFCPHAPDSHEAVVMRPICIDRPARVLFEGTLGRCLAGGCDCPMWLRADAAAGEDGF